MEVCRQCSDSLGWYKKFLRCIALSIPLLAGSGTSATGAEIEDLYQAEVPVASQSAEDRNVALRGALAAVLVKVTGHREFVALPELTPAFEQASRYMEQYRYRDAPTTGVPLPGSQSLAPYLLVVRFDRNAINKILEKAGLPVWGSTRPLVLVWLAVQDRGERYLVDPEIHGDIKDAVMQRAKERGLPVVFPILDLEDRQKIDVADVWGNFSDRILEASKRYRADAVLVGRVHQEQAEQWQGRWSLYLRDGQQTWQTVDATLAWAAADGLDNNADLLGQRFAQVLGSSVQERVTLELLDVNSYDAYSRSFRYLSSLDQVLGVQVATVEPARLVFDVSIRGGREGFERIVGLGNVLDRVDIRPAGGSSSGATGTPDQGTIGTRELSLPDLTYRVLP